MSLEILRRALDADDLDAICRSVGWGQVDRKQYELAVANSIACVCAVLDGTPVGSARLVGFYERRGYAESRPASRYLVKTVASDG